VQRARGGALTGITIPAIRATKAFRGITLFRGTLRTVIVRATISGQTAIRLQRMATNEPKGRKQ
jgi:hypothetical protein